MQCIRFPHTSFLHDFSGRSNSSAAETNIKKTHQEDFCFLSAVVYMCRVVALYASTFESPNVLVRTFYGEYFNLFSEKFAMHPFHTFRINSTWIFHREREREFFFRVEYLLLRSLIAYANDSDLCNNFYVFLCQRNQRTHRECSELNYR